MTSKLVSIRPFIGAKDFELSRRFYSDLGFIETVLSHNLSVFQNEGLSFYLQDYYVKDWIDNLMLFLQVADVDQYWNELVGLNLPEKYPSVKLSAPRSFEWGKECYLHDPSGVLWHIGTFNGKV